jgi:hypothetical protein
VSSRCPLTGEDIPFILDRLDSRYLTWRRATNHGSYDLRVRHVDSGKVLDSLRIPGGLLLDAGFSHDGQQIQLLDSDMRL